VVRPAVPLFRTAYRREVPAARKVGDDAHIPRSMGRLLIVIGVVFVLAGLLWPWLTRLGLGRLPGDIVIEHGNVSFYFPIVTSIVISIVLSLVFWLINR
jgi:Protein of unknown function (DUF2905)